MKKFYILIIMSLLTLVACKGNLKESSFEADNSKVEQDDYRNPDIMKRKDGIYHEFIYIEGKKVEVEFAKYGGHLQMSYLGKIYFINEVDYKELKVSDNNLFKARLERVGSESGEIISYHKHGNVWHVITKNGEYYTEEDPALKADGNQYVPTEFTHEAKKEDQVFEKIYKHKDHIHVWYKGEEYIISPDEYEEAVKNGSFTPAEGHEGKH